MADWRTQTLGDLCTLRGGGAFPQDEQGSTSGDYPFIKVSDLADSGTRNIRTARNWVTRSQLERMTAPLIPSGATVFAKIGEGLRRERFRMTTQETAIDNNLMAAIPRRTCDPRFLCYLLSTLGISDFAAGSALPYLRQSTLQYIECRVPSLTAQGAIGQVLGALDDKIAANTSLVAAADELAQTIYQQLIKQHPSTSALTEMADFVNGRAFTKNATGTGRVVIRIAELNSGLGNSTVYSDIIVDDHFIARPGDLLFAWSGSLTVHRWFREDAIINQHIFKVIPKAGWPSWAVHAALNDRLSYFQGVAADKATTMGHIQRRHLDEPVTLPTTEAVSSADPIVDAIWHRALSAELESERLGNMRDTLLPRLMSGELRVRDAEKLVEEVV